MANAANNEEVSLKKVVTAVVALVVAADTIPTGVGLVRVLRVVSGRRIRRQLFEDL